jgi:transposase-like protein
LSGGDAEEKAAVVQEIHAPGVSVSLVAAPGGGLNNNRILRAFRYSQEEIEVARRG